MKKLRKFSLSLSRTFDRTANPVYLVDADREIAYMNAACLAWVGLDAETAVETKVVFSSELASKNPPETATGESRTSASERLAGLCPPPELLKAVIEAEASTTPLPTTTRIFCHSDQLPQQLRFRQATLTRLVDEANELLGVLVIAEATDAPAGSDANETSSAAISDATLHETLALIRQHHLTAYSTGNLIGSSPFADRLRRQVAAIDGLNAEVVITGPPGSGREHLARTITTAQSTDEELRLSILHCVLADEELAKDAFDRTLEFARARRAHRPANVAAQPTGQLPVLLLLDIDKLPPEVLPPVQNFLARHANACQVISTSETSLIELAKAANFPAELAHQLSTIEVPLIPLVHRRQDIPLLAQAFVEQANQHREQQLAGFDDAASQLLLDFDFPGNLEQLQQVVHDACQTATGPHITADDLPNPFRHAVRAQQIGQHDETTIDLPQWLEQFELELVQRAFAETKGNKAKAAQLLGITRSKLLRRLTHFGIKDTDAKAAETSSQELLDSSAFEELE